MKNTLPIAALAALLCGPVLHAADAPSAPSAPSSPSGSQRHPMALKAEATFFALLNDATGTHEAARKGLTTAYALDANDPRTATLLGLDELWLASQGGGADPMAVPHLVLSEHYLARARALNPKDERIASWIVPARLALLGVERRGEGSREPYEELRAAYEKNPGFQSFSLALVSSHQPADSPGYQQGLAALRAVLAGGCREAGNPSCNNRPRWPHNVEGFVFFAAEYEAKAGNLDRAASLIAELKSRPDWPTWPYQEYARELEEKVAAARTHPVSFAPGKRSTCESCHRGK